MISFTAQLIKTLQITIPIMVSNNREEEDFMDDDSMKDFSKVPKFDPSV